MGRRQTRSEEAVNLAHEFMDEADTDFIDMDSFTDWAIAMGRYARPPKAYRQQAKEDLTRLLRSARHTDRQGRSVRSMQAVPIQIAGEQQPLLFSWVDARTARPDEMRAALAYTRQAILSDVKRHKADADSYNDNNIHGAQIPPSDYNFNTDLVEMSLPSEYDEDALGEELERELEAS